jgi:hypothetical protein
MAGLVSATPIILVHRCRTRFSSWQQATEVPCGEAEPRYRGRRDKPGDDAHLGAESKQPETRR